MNREIPPIVKNLLIINVLMLIGTFVMERLGIDLTQYLGLHFWGSKYFFPHQYVTYMFMHGGFFHLFFNMFALWMFGSTLEYVWGGKRFLTYYLVTGIGAAVLQSIVNYLILHGMVVDLKAFVNTPTPDVYYAFIKDHVGKPASMVYDFYNAWSLDPDNGSFATQAVAQLNNFVNSQINIPTVGASGAVYGVLLAFGMLFPNTQLMLLFPPIPIRAKWLVIIYGGLELYLGLTQPGSSVAHLAHVGGMLFGFLLIKHWQKDRTRMY